MPRLTTVNNRQHWRRQQQQQHSSRLVRVLLQKEMQQLFPLLFFLRAAASTVSFLLFIFSTAALIATATSMEWIPSAPLTTGSLGRQHMSEYAILTATAMDYTQAVALCAGVAPPPPPPSSGGGSGGGEGGAGYPSLGFDNSSAAAWPATYVDMFTMLKHSTEASAPAFPAHAWVGALVSSTGANWTDGRLRGQALNFYDPSCTVFTVALSGQRDCFVASSVLLPAVTDVPPVQQLIFTNQFVSLQFRPAAVAVDSHVVCERSPCNASIDCGVSDGWPEGTRTSSESYYPHCRCFPPSTTATASASISSEEGLSISPNPDELATKTLSVTTRPSDTFSSPIAATRTRTTVPPPPISSTPANTTTTTTIATATAATTTTAVVVAVPLPTSSNATPSASPAPAVKPTVSPAEQPPKGAGEATTTVGVIGGVTSPLSGADALSSIQLLAIFAVMTCGVPGAGDREGMAAFLTPVDIGGRFGKLVGQLVLLAALCAVYAAVLAILTRVLGWERARRLLRHPRFLPLVVVLAYPGVTFESAMLAYGLGASATVAERSAGVLGLLACVALLGAYYGLTHHWHRAEPIATSAVAYPVSALAALPAPVRVLLAPRCFWPDAVSLSGRCVYASLRPERARIAVGHSLVRILLVSVVCAVFPASQSWCQGILVVAAAVCLLHACFVLVTLCYRIPLINATQALQSAAVGVIALSKAVEGLPPSIPAVTALLVVGFSLVNMLLSLVVFVLERCVLVPAAQRAAQCTEVAAAEENGEAAGTPAAAGTEKESKISGGADAIAVLVSSADGTSLPPTIGHTGANITTSSASMVVVTMPPSDDDEGSGRNTRGVIIKNRKKPAMRRRRGGRNEKSSKGNHYDSTDADDAIITDLYACCEDDDDDGDDADQEPLRSDEEEGEKGSPSSPRQTSYENGNADVGSSSVTCVSQLECLSARSDYNNVINTTTKSTHLLQSTGGPAASTSSSLLLPIPMHSHSNALTGTSAAPAGGLASVPSFRRRQQRLCFLPQDGEPCHNSRGAPVAAQLGPVPMPSFSPQSTPRCELPLGVTNTTETMSALGGGGGGFGASLGDTVRTFNRSVTTTADGDGQHPDEDVEDDDSDDRNNISQKNSSSRNHSESDDGAPPFFSLSRGGGGRGSNFSSRSSSSKKLHHYKIPAISVHHIQIPEKK